MVDSAAATPVDDTAPNMLTLAGGRCLAWSENGAPDGRPVLVLHGSPGCRLSRYADDAALRALGIRQISYDRPGYGWSDALPERKVSDAVDDIRAVLDAAGVERAAIIGTSGGGPHALAAATLLGQRITVAYCNVSVAPRALLGEQDFFDGMEPENVRRFRAAQNPRVQVHAEFAPQLQQALAAAQVDPLQLLGRMQLPPADAAILRQQGADLAKIMQEAMRAGFWGFVDDFCALSRDWGFDPRNAKVPVIVEYGLGDVNVPAAHGRWLAENIPGAREVVTASGHLSGPQAILERLKLAAAA